MNKETLNKAFYYLGTYAFPFAVFGFFISFVMYKDLTESVQWLYLAVVSLFSRSAYLKEEVDKLRKEIKDDQKGE